MRIVFLPIGCLPFDGKTLEHRALGGTETGVIRLAQALRSMGDEVIVLTEEKNPPLTDPLYVPLSAAGLLGKVDILIGVREWQSLFIDIPATKKFLWTGDAFDQPSTVGIGDKRIFDKIDGLLCVSEWQRQTLCSVSGFPTAKAFVIRNGVHLPFFARSANISVETGPNAADEPVENPSLRRKRMIYSSTPYRGLKYLLPIFQKVKQRVVDAELVIASGYEVYAGKDPVPVAQLKELEVLKSEFEALPGVRWLGNIKQAELAKEMLASGIYAYPNIFAETSCISVLEAKAAGAVPVTTDIGALPETVGKGGILISPSVINEKSGPKSALNNSPEMSKEVIENFAKIISDLMLDSDLWSSLSISARDESVQSGWETVAGRVINVYQQ